MKKFNALVLFIALILATVQSFAQTTYNVDHFTDTPAPTAGSLQFALANASPGDTIKLTSDITATANLANIANTSNITITGAPLNTGDPLFILDGGRVNNTGGFAGLTVTNKALTLDQIILRNFYRASGGVLLNSAGTSTITLKNANISNNAASQGGFYYQSGAATLNLTAGTGGATFSNNTASSGGVFYNNSAATMNLTADGGDIVFDGNKATGSTGGAISSINSATLNLTSANNGKFIFKNNTSITSGGALYWASANRLNTWNLTGAEFTNNSTTSGSAGSGGAMYLTGGTYDIDLDNAAISNNKSYQNGGAFYIAGVASGSNKLSLQNTVISSNTATTGAGAFYITGGSWELDLTGTNVYGNKPTSGNGGAFYFNPDAASSNTIILSTGTAAGLITANTVTANGGAIYANAGSWDIQGGIFKENTAGMNSVFYPISAGQGGAIYFAGTPNVKISNTSFLHNAAGRMSSGGYGGALYFGNLSGAQKIDIINSIFTGNQALSATPSSTTAGSTGGAIYNVASNATINITNSKFENNEAQIGGAIYSNGSQNTLTVTGSNSTNILAKNFAITDNWTSYFKGNSVNSLVQNPGAAIYSAGTGSKLNIESVLFDSNISQIQHAAASTTMGGGTIYLANNGVGSIKDSLFVNNSMINSVTSGESNIFGSVIGVSGAEMTIDNTKFLNNSSFAASETPSSTYEVEADGIIAILGNNTKLTVTNSWFEGNTSANNDDAPESTNYKSYGGSILLSFTTGTTYANFTDTTFTKNKFTSAGYGICAGVICNFQGNIVVNRDLFDSNEATAYKTLNGGVLGNYASGSGSDTFNTISVTDSTFTGNKAESKTGAVYGGVIINGTATSGSGTPYGGKITVTGSDFINNTVIADGNIYGGAIANYKGTLNVSGSTFKDNTATSTNGLVYGGALYQSVNGGAINVSDSTFQGYDISGTGGAIFNTQTAATTNISSSTFASNTASALGGAIYNIGKINVDGSFTNNTANYGGAIYNDNTGNTAQTNLQVNEGTTFTGNKALNSGGAIYNASTATTPTLNTVFKSAFENNTATNNGGAIYNSGIFTVRASSFTGNTATNNGGAIYNTGKLYLVAQNGNTQFNTTSDSIFSSGNLYLNAAAKESIIFNGAVKGQGTANLYINTNVPGNFATGGYIQVNDELSGFSNVFVESGTLQIGATGQFGLENAPINLSMTNASRLDLVNDTNITMYLNNFTLTDTALGYITVASNLDFAGSGATKIGKSDLISVAGRQNGTLYYDAFRILNENAYQGVTDFKLMNDGVTGIKIVNGYVDTGTNQFSITQNPDNKGNNWIRLARTISPFNDPLRDAIYITYNDNLGIRAPEDYLGGNGLFAFAADASGNIINYYANDYGAPVNNVADMPINTPTTPVVATNDYRMLTINGYDNTRNSVLDAGVYTANDHTTTPTGGVALLTNNSILSVNNVTIRNAESNGGYDNGAAINNTGRLLTDNVLFENNSSVNGGAIYTSSVINPNGDPMNVLLSNTSFTGNTATQSGGAVYNNNAAGSETKIQGAEFTGNTAADGGAIYNDGDLKVIGSTFTDNTATGKGQAIYNAGNLILQNSDFNYTATVPATTYNSATIYNTGDIRLIALAEDILLQGNRTGAIESDGGNVYINTSATNSATFQNVITASNGAILTINDDYVLGTNDSGDNIYANSGAAYFNADITGFNTVNSMAGLTYLGGNAALTTGILNLGNSAEFMIASQNASVLNIDTINLGQNSRLKLDNNIITDLNLGNLNMAQGSTLDSINGLIGDRLLADSLTADNSNLSVDLNFNGANSDMLWIDNPGATGTLKINNFMSHNEDAYRAPTTFNIVHNKTSLDIAANPFYNGINGQYIIVNNNDGSLTFVFDSRPYTDPLINAIFLTSTNLDVTGKGDATYDMEADPFNPVTQEYNYTAYSDISSHIISDNNHTNTLTVTGKNNLGGDNYYIDGSGTYALFNVAQSGGLALEDVTIKNAKADSTTTITNGAAVNNQGTLNVDNVSFQDNTAAEGDGGAIYNTGTATIDNAYFGGNYAYSDGGAIYNDGDMTITDSVFENNTADTRFGQAIYNRGDLTLTNVTIQNHGNSSYALHNATAATSLNITGSANFNNNEGGAIYSNSAEDVSLSATTGNITFSNNAYDIYTAGNLLLTSNGGNMSFTAPVEVDGDLTLSALNGNVTFGSNAQVDSHGAFKASATGGNIIFGGQLNTYDTFVANVSAGRNLTFKDIDGNDTMQLNNSGTVTVNGLVKNFNALALTGGTLNFSNTSQINTTAANPWATLGLGANSTTNFAGAFANSNLYATAITMANGSTLNLTHGAAQTINANSLTLGDNTTLNLMNGFAGDTIRATTLAASTTTGAKSNIGMDLNLGSNGITPTSDKLALGTSSGNLYFNKFRLQNYDKYVQPITFTVIEGGTTAHVSTIAGITVGKLNDSDTSYTYKVKYNGDGTITLGDIANPYRNDWLKNVIEITNDLPLQQPPVTQWLGLMDGDYTASSNLGSSFQLSDNHLLIDSNTTGTSYTISGANAYELFNIASAATLDIANTNISNAVSSGNGAAVNNSGIFTADNITFADNASANGGAVYNIGTATLTNADFASNSAAGNGGAVNNTGNMTITGGSFIDNTAQGLGQAIYNSGTLTLIDTLFTYTPAATIGGTETIYNTNIFTIKADATDIVFEGNGAGAMYNGNKTTLTTSAGRSITFNDVINNATGAEIIINGDIKLNNHLNGGNLNIFNGSVTLGNTLTTTGNINTANTILAADTSLNVNTTNAVNMSLGKITLNNNSKIDLRNNTAANTIEGTTLTANNGKLGLSLNFADNTSDKINLTGAASGTMEISDINIINEKNYNSITNAPSLVDEMIFNILNGADLTGLALTTTTAGVTHTGYNTSYFTEVLKTDTKADLKLSAATTGITEAGTNTVLLANTYDKGWLLNVDGLADGSTANLTGTLYVRGTTDNATIAANSMGGGSFNNQGTLDIKDITIASVITNNANLRIENSLINSTANNGGLLNAPNGIAEIIDSNFTNNTAINGGAINNTNGTVTITALTKNVAITGNTANNQGSAIYNNNGNITLSAIGSNITISSNTSTTGGAGLYNTGDSFINLNATGGDIEIKEDIVNNARINFTSSGSHHNYIGGTVTGNGELNADNADIIFDNDLTGFTGKTTLADSSITLASLAGFFGGEVIVNSASNLYMANSVATTIDLAKVTLNGQLNVDIDVDLVDLTKRDNFVGAPMAGTEKINIKGISLTNSTTKAKTDVQVADADAMDYISLDSNYSLYNALYKYKVDYSTLTGLGILTFTRDIFNPAAFVPQVAMQTGGYFNQLQAYSQGFGVMEQNAMDEDVCTSCGVWLKPYTYKEDVKFNNMPYTVDNSVSGAYFGFDTAKTDLGKGYNGNISVYAGYNGGKQTYQTVRIEQDGGILGVAGAVYKGAFFAGATIAAGVNQGYGYTENGRETFNMFTAGIGAKAGYNINLNDVFKLQPMLSASYTLIDMGNYTNAYDAYVDAKAFMPFTVQPQVKLGAQLGKGWAANADLSYVYGLNNKTEAYSDGTQLPKISIKNGYVQYGLGVSKDITKNLNIGLDGFGRAVDRSGFGGQLNIRWSFGGTCKNNDLARTSQEMVTVTESETMITEEAAQQPQAHEARSLDLDTNYFGKNALFGFDKYTPSKEYADYIYQQIQGINGKEYGTIAITGYTDNIGPASYNKQLSEKRAQAVYDIFMENGLPAEKLTYSGEGEANPVATNKTKAGRATNRRVEVKVLK